MASLSCSRRPMGRLSQQMYLYVLKLTEKLELITLIKAYLES